MISEVPSTKQDEMEAFEKLSPGHVEGKKTDLQSLNTFGQETV